jgi:hypothetical protein
MKIRKKDDRRKAFYTPHPRTGFSHHVPAVCNFEVTVFSSHTLLSKGLYNTVFDLKRLLLSFYTILPSSDHF